mgnify:CR=1 FL=1
MQSASVKGLLLIVCGPSGVGKSSLCQRLRQEFPRLKLSISCTTRAPRGQEQDGTHYHFMSDEAFVDLINQGAFAEHAKVHGNRYGTLRSTVEEIIGVGNDMLFDIDYQGARQLKAAFPQARSILLLPPSITELERRLRSRATDDDDVILRRLDAARHEMSHYGSFDFALVNDDLDAAYQRLKTVYQALQQEVRYHAPLLERLLE